MSVDAALATTAAAAEAPAKTGAEAQAAAVAGDDPLGFMQKVNDSIYYCAAGGPATNPSTSPTAKPPPRLVVMTSWMGARPLYIAKYLAPYMDGRLFAPGDRPAIVLVRCSEQAAFSDPKAAAVATVAASLIQTLVDTKEEEAPATTKTIPVPPDTEPTVLVHSFSNGGCKMLAHLYVWLHDPVEKTSALPPHVTIFDSSPGHVSYSVSVAAVAVQLRNQPRLLQMAALPLVHAFVAVRFVDIWAQAAWGNLVKWWHDRNRAPASSSSSVPEVRHPALTPGPVFFWTAHNDTSPLSGNRREVRRAYLYSYADPLIPGKDVEQHAAEATAAGYTVARMEEFPNSPHVAHARTDAPRYWQIVSDLWAGV